MCGLSGFVNIKDSNDRLNLVFGLGLGIDDRGGDAAGYVSIASGKLRYAKKIGTWLGSRDRFMAGAAKGDMCMMHARFATCGSNNMESAHPYTIRRNGKVVLWGMHNGVIPDAWDSAKDHNRECIVDSKELFELIADRELKSIQKMDGYGVITWIEANDTSHIKLARLSEHSDIYVVETSDGGMVWASTWQIISDALDFTNLKAVHSFQLDEIGRVYEIYKDKILISHLKGVHLSDRWDQMLNSKTYLLTNLLEDTSSNKELDELDARWEEFMVEEGSREYQERFLYKGM